MFRNWSRSNYRTTSVIERDLHPSIVLATNKRACVEFREPIRWGFDRETATPCEKGEKRGRCNRPLISTRRRKEESLPSESLVINSR